MNHFTNQFNGSHCGHPLMGRAMLRRFALFFPMILLMLLFLPARMVAQPGASSSEYIATYDSDTETLTFEKGESLSTYSVSVKDGMQVGKQFGFHSTGIKHIVLDESFETFSPTTLNHFFANLTQLETITGLEYLNTVNVTDMSFLFYGCEKLTSLDLSYFNTANVTNMSSMFDGCTGLSSLDVTNFNTANVTNMRYMFSGCYKLKEIYISSKFVTDTVKSSEDMFWGCNSLSGDIDWTSDKATDKTYAKTGGGYFRDKAYDNRPFVKFADGTLTFRCGYKKIFGDKEYALNSGDSIPAWNKSINNIPRVVFDASFANARPTTCYAWFKNFTNLTQIEGIENLNTEKVTNMRSMFSTCLCLKSLDVTNFNTANVKDMGSMFSGCRNLAELDLSNFNTANVENMRSMFSECKNLAELDLSNFNTAKVTNMGTMFSGCLNLTTIYVNDDFVITKKSYYLFSGCTKLKGAIDFDKLKTNSGFANYTTGYFTKLVGKNGDEKIGATGETLTTNNLVLVDDKDFVAYEPFAAKAASYSRKMKEGTTWATLCLPFEVSLENQNFRAFKLLSADEGTETVELEEIEGSIAAGTPVIIKMKDGATQLDFTVANKAIAKDVQTAETANGNYQLQGLYTQKVFSKDTDNNCYIVKGDKLMNPAKLLDKTTTESVGSKPFRAYMVDNSSAPAAGARMFCISVGGSTTAIEQLETTADSKAEYYDLQGHRLQDLQKGVNIVKRGGKTMKVIIK